MIRSSLVVLLSIAASAALAAAPATSTDLQCESIGPGPQLLCIVTVHNPAGKPAQGATITLGATLPASTSAPPVRPATATGGAKAGEDRGVLDPSGPGVWTVMIDIAGPVRDRLARSVKVEACAAGKRCPAAPIAETPAAKAKK